MIIFFFGQREKYGNFVGDFNAILLTAQFRIFFSYTIFHLRKAYKSKIQPYERISYTSKQVTDKNYHKQIFEFGLFSLKFLQPWIFIRDAHETKYISGLFIVENLILKNLTCKL